MSKYHSSSFGRRINILLQISTTNILTLKKPSWHGTKSNQK